MDQRPITGLPAEGQLLAARYKYRNRLLFWVSLQAGELLTNGDLDTRTAVRLLTSAPTLKRRSLAPTG